MAEQTINADFNKITGAAAADVSGDSISSVSSSARFADFSNGITGVRFRRTGVMASGGFSVYGVTRLIE